MRERAYEHHLNGTELKQAVGAALSVQGGKAKAPGKGKGKKPGEVAMFSTEMSLEALDDIIHGSHARELGFEAIVAALAARSGTPSIPTLKEWYQGRAETEYKVRKGDKKEDVARALLKILWPHNEAEDAAGEATEEVLAVNSDANAAKDKQTAAASNDWKCQECGEIDAQGALDDAFNQWFCRTCWDYYNLEDDEIELEEDEEHQPQLQHISQPQNNIGLVRQRTAAFEQQAAAFNALQQFQQLQLQRQHQQQQQATGNRFSTTPLPYSGWGGTQGMPAF